jgi:ADP-heptose:LPS heptosyltransferase
MPDKKVYIIRWGAYGDHVHMTNVIKAFDEDGWDVTMEYNIKGAQIHSYNPRIKKHVFLEPTAKEHLKKGKFWLSDHLKSIEKEYDKVVNLQGSLEGALIAGKDRPMYYWPKSMRNARNTHICYYDQSMIWAGLTDKKYMGWSGEIYFPKEEHEFVKTYLEKNIIEPNKKFTILWALRGTMWQKAIYPIAKDVCNEFLRRHPDAHIITTGDDFCKKWEWEHDRVSHKSGRIPYRQALLMSRYMDLVVTPETGLGIGAGAYGTPKIMLLTAASLKNIVGNDNNDFSLQSDAWCSPCTRAIYDTDQCMCDEVNNLPICVAFDKEKVLNQMETVYEKVKNNELYYLRQDDDALEGRSVYM